MKIAIDVHSLGTQAGGNETFYRQLLEGLGSDSGPNDYTLLYTHANAAAGLELDHRFRWQRIASNPLQRICYSIPRALKALKPDVFHCQYVLPPGVNTKSVVTIHDLVYEHYPQFSPGMEGVRMRKMVRWSAGRADHVITDSQYSAADIEGTYGLPQRKITVAYLAAGERFHPRDKQECSAHLHKVYGIDSPFILYVGRVQARKNLLRLVDAYVRLREQRTDTKLVIVGKPDFQYKKLLARVSELGLKDAVYFPGYVSATDLPLFYNAAEMFVFPSIFEGFGLPVMESMASGVPTVTSQGSCLAEVAGDGALLVDPLSTDSIADAMMRILGSVELQRELRERGLRRSASFSVKAFANTILSVYRSLVPE